MPIRDKLKPESGDGAKTENLNKIMYRKNKIQEVINCDELNVHGKAKP